jgi:hypothetical protein
MACLQVQNGATASAMDGAAGDMADLDEDVADVDDITDTEDTLLDEPEDLETGDNAAELDAELDESTDDAD